MSPEAEGAAAVRVAWIMMRPTRVFATGVVALAIMASSCSPSSDLASSTATSIPTTANPETAAPPAIPAARSMEEAQLQARAMIRGCGSCDEQPVCIISATTSPELHGVIEDIFPVEVEWVPSLPSITVAGSTVFRCLATAASHIEVLANDVVGIDVMVSRSVGAAMGRTYQFRWNGSGWVDTTPEETGITTTTSVE
jgi:hypothetical protein